ncbi:hypothetical protein THAOC_31023 [Thalassiosira oceanica]|uniref:Uncharacterized protein n=1 Tax=Thalassiosira oceanica TaxID=159749 RepID=K0RTN1_THAOC|nr:hypothetical protein THAOC_31023 [Thalassiosira oceanica]|eukprot:EJK50047.1 hypothetical protein THAOC_31023 [Thalassiosira oceanica]
MLSLADTTARAFGNLFDVRTLPGASTVVVTGLEIYSSSTGVVEYEVYTRDGTWEGTEGDLSSYALIASGALESTGMCDGSSAEICEFVPIPPGEFESVPIRGNGAVRSFYVTLKTREMLYQRDAVGSEDEYGVLAATPDIEVLEGAAVLQYPYSKARDDVFYKRPRAFLGKVSYIRNPCLEEDGEPNYEWPCPTRAPVVLVSVQPTVEPSTAAPTKEPTYVPTIEWESKYTPAPSPVLTDTTVVGDGGAGPGHSSSVGDGESSSSSVGDGGTSAPPPPAADGPTRPDDGSYAYVSPEKPPPFHPGAVFIPNNEGRMKYSGPGANDTIVVLRIGEVQKDRLMQEREIEKYCDVVFEFLKSLPGLERANVHVLNVEVHYQESRFAKIQKKKKKKIGNKNEEMNDMNPEEVAKRRRGQEVVEAAEQLAANETEAPDELPPAYLEVTTIITTINSILPPEVTSFLINEEIESNAAVLAEDLFKWRTFYGVFLEVDRVSVRLIDRATDPPTLQPTTYAHFLSLNATLEDDAEDTANSVDFITLVGLGIGMMWAILTLFSLRNIWTARKEFKRENMLRNTNVSKSASADPSADPRDDENGPLIPKTNFEMALMAAQRRASTAERIEMRASILQSDDVEKGESSDPETATGPVPATADPKPEQRASFARRGSTQSAAAESDTYTDRLRNASDDGLGSLPPRHPDYVDAASTKKERPSIFDQSMCSECSDLIEASERSGGSRLSALLSMAKKSRRLSDLRKKSVRRAALAAKPAAASSRRMTASTKEVDSDSDSTDSGNTSSDDSVTDSSDSSSSESSTEDNVAPPPRLPQARHATRSASMIDISTPLIKVPAASEPATRRDSTPPISSAPPTANDSPRLPQTAQAARSASMIELSAPLIKNPADSEPVARRNSAHVSDLPSRRKARRRNSRKHGNLPEKKFGNKKKERTKSGLFIVPPDVLARDVKQADASEGSALEEAGRPALRANTGERALHTVPSSDASEGSALEQAGRPALRANTGKRALLSSDASEGSAIEQAGRPALRANTGERALVLAPDASDGSAIKEDNESLSADSEIDRPLSDPGDADFNRDPSEGSAFKREAEGSSTSETSSNVTKDESDGGFSAREGDHHASPDSLSAPMHETAKVQEVPGLSEEELDHPSLRFEVGQTVYCKIGPNPIDWKKGKVAKLWHREKSWPPDMVAPYKVKLGKKKYIFAPRDSDDLVFGVSSKYLSSSNESSRLQRSGELLALSSSAGFHSMTPAAASPTAALSSASCLSTISRSPPSSLGGDSPSGDQALFFMCFLFALAPLHRPKQPALPVCQLCLQPRAFVCGFAKRQAPAAKGLVARQTMPPPVHAPPGASAPQPTSCSERADAAPQPVQTSGGVQTTTVATIRATQQIEGGGRGANGGSSKRPPYKKGDIVKVLFKSVKDMFGQHQSEWYTGAVVKTRVTKDSKQTIDVQFSHDYRLQIDGCPRPEVSKQDGVTSMDSPIFYPQTFGAGDLVDVYFENQTRKLNRGRVLNVSEDTRRVGVVYYEDNYMRGGRYEASIPTDVKKIRLVERLGANLGWMNGKSAVINGRTGTVKSCGQPDACCRVTFNERESTAVSATEAAKGVLGIIMSRLEVTVWPVDPPARLSAEARLSRQAGGRSVSVKSGNRGAAETASRTSHEKALPSGAKPVDSATNTTTLGQARVHSNSAAGAPSARPFSDRRNAAVVNPDHRVSADWRREVARDKRVKMLVDIFPFVSSKLGDKMSKEHKITVTKHLEDLLFRESPSFDTYIDMSTLKLRLEKLYQKISRHNKMAKAAKQQQVMGQCAAATGATPAVMAEENSQLAVLTVAPQAKHALSSLSGDTQSSSKRQKLPSSAASTQAKGQLARQNRLTDR